jgi:FtsP/CotA-like multicopper oxidase with cupredoxin domain
MSPDRLLLVLATASLVAPGISLAQASADAVPRISINDNRTAGGMLREGVLTIKLQVQRGMWHPDRDDGPGIPVLAFGEEGKPLQIPGPLIRVPAGTEIRATIRNAGSDSTIVVQGLAAPNAAEGSDTIHVKPGEVREVRFLATTPGTYFYRCRAMPRQTPVPGGICPGAASQLNGAIVVDEGTTSGASRDRVLVLGLWIAPGQERAGLGRNGLNRFVINGKSWPNTERLSYGVGDTVRIRVLNTSSAPHPMHLHGFYFNVDARGDGRSDTTYGGTRPHLAVTERAAPGRTFSMTWIPERPGNWMFHCHDNFHVLRNRPLDGSPFPSEIEQLGHAQNHSMEMMGGLVMGVEVHAKGPTPVTTDVRARRTLRLVSRVDTGGTALEPNYGYVLQAGKQTMPASGPLLPGPTIVLKRGEPVAITVVNELPEATSVHWHGIELDSYYDGVAGFSGSAGRISPAIAPRDSFVARFTPPRSGTFIYHPHADEVRQQQAGLTGAIVVVDDPATYNAGRDLVVMISTPRRAAENATVYLNGSNTPVSREWRVGERYRIRFINIHTARPSMIGRLMRDSTTLTWRAVAKDGADLPAERAIEGPAMQQIGNGEAYDFEFTPTVPGDLRFVVTQGNGVHLATMPIRVR